MAKYPSITKISSSAGFLGMAAVVTLHKAVAIAERARHKPDKDAHEVRSNTERKSLSKLLL